MKYYGKIQDIKDLTTKEYVDKKLNIEQADETFVLKQENVDVTENVALALNEYIKSASIIDCDSLPTEEIADNTIYRVKVVKKVPLPGTPVPTDGTSGSVYVNNLISDERLNELAQLMRENAATEGPVSLYAISASSFGSKILECASISSSSYCIDYMDSVNDIRIILYVSDDKIASMIGEDVTLGWNQEIDFSEPFEITFSDGSETYLGGINDQLTELFSLTAFEMSEEIIGYDYYIYKEGWQRLSTGLDVKEKTYGELIERAIPNQGKAGDIIFDTNLSVEEVLDIVNPILENNDWNTICYFGGENGVSFYRDPEINVIIINFEDSINGLSMDLFVSSEVEWIPFVGWNPDFNGILSNFNGCEYLNDCYGDIVGQYNEELINLCWEKVDNRETVLETTSTDNKKFMLVPENGEENQVLTKTKYSSQWKSTPKIIGSNKTLFDVDSVAIGYDTSKEVTDPEIEIKEFGAPVTIDGLGTFYKFSDMSFTENSYRGIYVIDKDNDEYWNDDVDESIPGAFFVYAGYPILVVYDAELAGSMVGLSLTSDMNGIYTDDEGKEWIKSVKIFGTFNTKVPVAIPDKYVDALKINHTWNVQDITDNDLDIYSTTYNKDTDEFVQICSVYEDSQQNLIRVIARKSKDLSNWTSYDIPYDIVDEYGPTLSIAYSNGNYFLFTGNLILKSSDLTSWEYAGGGDSVSSTKKENGSSSTPVIKAYDNYLIALDLDNFQEAQISVDGGNYWGNTTIDPEINGEAYAVYIGDGIAIVISYDNTYIGYLSDDGYAYWDRIASYGWGYFDECSIGTNVIWDEDKNEFLALLVEKSNIKDTNSSDNPLITVLELSKNDMGIIAPVPLDEFKCKPILSKLNGKYILADIPSSKIYSVDSSDINNILNPGKFEYIGDFGGIKANGEELIFEVAGKNLAILGYANILTKVECAPTLTQKGENKSEEVAKAIEPYFDLGVQVHEEKDKYAVPSSGEGEKIYFDTSMSIDEVDNLLYSINTLEEGSIYICATSDGDAELFIDYYDDYPRIMLYDRSSNDAMPIYNQGWDPEFNGIITSFADKQLFSATDIGQHNKELIDLCWCGNGGTKFTVNDSDGNKYKLATGLDVVEDKIHIAPKIGDRDIKLHVNTDIPTYDLNEKLQSIMDKTGNERYDILSFNYYNKDNAQPTPAISIMYENPKNGFIKVLMGDMEVYDSSYGWYPESLAMLKSVNNILNLPGAELVPSDNISYIYNDELLDLIYIESDEKQFSVIDSEGEKHKINTGIEVNEEKSCRPVSAGTDMKVKLNTGLSTEEVVSILEKVRLKASEKSMYASEYPVCYSDDSAAILIGWHQNEKSNNYLYQIAYMENDGTENLLSKDKNGITGIDIFNLEDGWNSDLSKPVHELTIRGTKLLSELDIPLNGIIPIGEYNDLLIDLMYQGSSSSRASFTVKDSNNNKYRLSTGLDVVESSSNGIIKIGGTDLTVKFDTSKSKEEVNAAITSIVEAFKKDHSGYGTSGYTIGLTDADNEIDLLKYNDPANGDEEYRICYCYPGSPVNDVDFLYSSAYGWNPEFVASGSTITLEGTQFIEDNRVYENKTSEDSYQYNNLISDIIYVGEKGKKFSVIDSDNNLHKLSTGLDIVEGNEHIVPKAGDRDVKLYINTDMPVNKVDELLYSISSKVGPSDYMIFEANYYNKSNSEPLLNMVVNTKTGDISFYGETVYHQQQGWDPEFISQTMGILDFAETEFIENSEFISYIYNEELKDLVYIQGSKEFSVVDSEGEKHKINTGIEILEENVEKHAIPNSGKGKEIYFDTTMSIEEVVNKLTPITESSDTSAYLICVADAEGIALEVLGDNEHLDLAFFNSVSAEPTIIFSSNDGWNPDFNGVITDFVGKTLIDTFVEGDIEFPIGQHNEKLVDLCWSNATKFTINDSYGNKYTLNTGIEIHEESQLKVVDGYDVIPSTGKGGKIYFDTSLIPEYVFNLLNSIRTPDADDYVICHSEHPYLDLWVDYSEQDSVVINLDTSDDCIPLFAYPSDNYGWNWNPEFTGVLTDFIDKDLFNGGGTIGTHNAELFNLCWTDKFEPVSIFTVNDSDNNKYRLSTGLDVIEDKEHIIPKIGDRDIKLHVNIDMPMDEINSVIEHILNKTDGIYYVLDTREYNQNDDSFSLTIVAQPQGSNSYTGIFIGDMKIYDVEDGWDPMIIQIIKLEGALSLYDYELIQPEDESVVSYIYNEELKNLFYIEGTDEFSVVDTYGEKHKLLVDKDFVEEPITEGTNGQVLTTDGAGGRNWTTIDSLKVSLNEKTLVFSY